MLRLSLAKCNVCIFVAHSESRNINAVNKDALTNEVKCNSSTERYVSIVKENITRQI